MRSLNRVGTQPMSLPLSADDIVEFHAARLLLLLHICGIKGRIDGLTKMAKLDFFVRYPEFFEVARVGMNPSTDTVPTTVAVNERVESAMVRYHYGPWDKRYYHVLAHLEAKGLIAVTKEAKSYRIQLTDAGSQRAKDLSSKHSFSSIVRIMGEVKNVFGRKNGNFLKELIYKLFDAEVGQRELGDVID